MKALFEKLWIVLDNENLFETNKNLWKNKIPFRYKKWLEIIKPDYFFIQKNKPIIFFFQWELRTELFTQIWNLWWVPIIYIVKNWDIEIYNWFDFDIKTKSFWKIENKNISILDLISWKSFENLHKKKNQVDKELLNNLKEVIKILENNWLDIIYSQSLVWRLFFSRFLIDNEISIDEKYFSNNISFLNLINDKTKLYNYFEYLKDKFNWDLFPITLEEKDLVNENHLNIIYDLFSWNKINWNSNQQSLFDIYDFKIIPVELISEVYEQFMWKEKQEKDWAYYTPSFLVDYILEKTIKKHLESNLECRIFDPSCGSWIFLVESFRFIVENNLDKEWNIEIEKLKNLLQNNIFWIDKNEIAVNLSIFSLYLTILDYINPKDIEKFKFPTIKNRNLFVWDFFDESLLFNKKIKSIDFVIWNPPWGDNKEKYHLEFIRKFEKEIWQKIISDNQIAQSFILKLQDFIDEKTKISLVLPSKILYNHNAKNFRQYFLKNFKLNEVLELSPVRKDVFSWAIAPTFISFFEKSNIETKKDNTVLYISIKPNIFLKQLKILVIEKNDIKEIEQNNFIKYDYLWKTMLYWNVFDFYFIKRLKENYSNLNGVIEKEKLYFWQWIQVWWWDKNNASHLIWKKFLDTWISKKALSKFFINDEILENFDKKTLHRPRNPDLFEKWPKILIKKWFNRNNFEIINCYTENEYVFTDSLTAIVWENREILKNITWIISSFYSTYFIVMQWSSAWIEREKLNDIDIYGLPIFIHNKISIFVDKIQELYIKLNSQILTEQQEIQNEIESLENQLNNTIYESFNLSIHEKTLIDYIREITIPLINNSSDILKSSNEKQLKEYTQIFLDDFWEIWNWSNWKFFEIDIYSNEYVIWINFKIVENNREEKIKIINDKEKIKEIFNLLKIWEEKITKDLYKIRDVRGFNENSFYLVKFNQMKNWHKAMAYVDIAEFRDAMMKSWLKKLKNN